MTGNGQERTLRSGLPSSAVATVKKAVGPKVGSGGENGDQVVVGGVCCRGERAARRRFFCSVTRVGSSEILVAPYMRSLRAC